MKNEDFDRLNLLFSTKSYDELGEQDRSWVDNVIGQEGYKRLSFLINEVSTNKTKKVSGHVKASLMKSMKAKHRGVISRLLSQKIPVYINVVMLAILIPTIWLAMPAKEVVVEKPVTITVPVVDTVILTLPRDTVFIERKVRVEVPIYLTNTVEPPIERKHKEVKSKPFAEEKALQDLLVSGR